MENLEYRTSSKLADLGRRLQEAKPRHYSSLGPEIRIALRRFQESDYLYPFFEVFYKGDLEE